MLIVGQLLLAHALLSGVLVTLLAAVSVAIGLSSANAAGICSFNFATGSGVRTPATTSSPWALIRNSP